MKILLTAINAKYIHSNLAVYCLKAYAQKYLENINIEIAEYTINQQLEDIMMDICIMKKTLTTYLCFTDTTVSPNKQKQYLF